MRSKYIDQVVFYIAATFAIAGLVLAASSCAPRIHSAPLAPLDHRVCFGTPMEVYCGMSLKEPECMAVLGAVDWWNHQLAGITFFQYRGHKYEPSLVPGRYPQNVLVVGMSPPAVAEVIPRFSDLIAVTTYRHHPQTLCLTAAMMFFNIRPENMSYEGAQNVLRHEMGHVLGLLDSDNDEGLLIRAADPNTLVLKHLDESEVNSLRAMYGGQL